MRIGELAAKAAVNVQTIRFYERRGIMPHPPRSRAGYRCYGESDLDILCFILRSQQLGFTLHEIAQLLPLHRVIANASCGKHTPPKSQQHEAEGTVPKPGEMRAMAEVARRRLNQVEEKLRLLKAMRARLLEFVDQLETTQPTRCLAPALPLPCKKKIARPA